MADKLKNVSRVSRRSLGRLAVGTALLPAIGGLQTTYSADFQSDGLTIPAKIIRVPTSISAEAQESLRRGAKQPATVYPPATDIKAWRKLLDESRAKFSRMAQGYSFNGQTTTVQLNGAKVFVSVPTTQKKEGVAILEIHGGAFVSGEGDLCRMGGQRQADEMKIITYAVDYRVPPDHRYPAALDDCIATYRGMLGSYKPENIIIAGTSAGGGLAASTVLRARDEGLPLPAGAALMSPEVDLTESGDSFEVHDTVDTVLPHRLTESIALYADGHDLKHPYLSPIFADFSKGYPPTLLQSGTRDLFLSNTVRMHRALRRFGIAAELHVFEAMPHAGFGNTPEDTERTAELRGFIYKMLRI